MNATTRFIEDGPVPDTTWRFVNKNGTPDRRFDNNRRLPVMQSSGPSGNCHAQRRPPASPRRCGFRLKLDHQWNQSRQLARV
jgi:hypothetical protein